MRRVPPPARAWALVRASALLAASACGPAEGRVVATDDPAAEIGGQRGRVAVVDGKLETDIGSPLRGLLTAVDVAPAWRLEDLRVMERVAREAGLNAVHVYLENWQIPPGTNVNAADVLVALTREAGLYLVLGLGGGTAGPTHPGNGWFDPNLVLGFWDFYAPRYAEETHVLYEIINNPELGCAAPLADATLAMENQVYARIRALAPDTHVLVFSMSAVPEPAVLTDAVARADGVDFSNASFAMHGAADCVELARFGEVEAALAATGTAGIVSQMVAEDFHLYVAELEPRRVGWMHHDFRVTNEGVDGVIEASRAAGITWCPDQGTFPQDSATCRPR